MTQLFARLDTSTGRTLLCGTPDCPQVIADAEWVQGDEDELWLRYHFRPDATVETRKKGRRLRVQCRRCARWSTVDATHPSPLERTGYAEGAEDFIYPTAQRLFRRTLGPQEGAKSKK